MAFYSQDPSLNSQLQSCLAQLALDRPGLLEQISVSWLVYEGAPLDLAAGLEATDLWNLPWRGAGHNSNQLRYPASVVKLFYAAALEAWMARDLLPDGQELRRAMADMLAHSSNDATGLVVDLLSGTTSGPELPADPLASWARQRQLVNRWFADLGWPEWGDCNACQKTWSEGPYGRERQFYGEDRQNRNRLSTDVTARLLHALMSGAWLSPLASARLRQLLQRSLDADQRLADPENQVDGFIGEALPEGSRLWSKAGWMSEARHDAAYCEVPQCPPFLLVVFSEGESQAKDLKLLPGLCSKLIACLSQPLQAS